MTTQTVVKVIRDELVNNNAFLNNINNDKHVFPFVYTSSTEVSDQLESHGMKIRKFNFVQVFDFEIGYAVKITIPFIQVESNDQTVRIRWKKHLEDNIISWAVCIINRQIVDITNRDIVNDYRKYIKSNIKITPLQADHYNAKTLPLYKKNLKSITIKVPLRFWYAYKPINNVQIPGMCAVSRRYAESYIYVQLSELHTLIESQDGKPILPSDIRLRGDVHVTGIQSGGELISEKVFNSHGVSGQPIANRSFSQHSISIQTNIAKRFVFACNLNRSTQKELSEKDRQLIGNYQQYDYGRNLVDFIVAKSPIKIKNFHLFLYNAVQYEFEYYKYSKTNKEHVYILDRRLCPIPFDNGFYTEVKGFCNTQKHNITNLCCVFTISKIITYKNLEGDMEFIFFRLLVKLIIIPALIFSSACPIIPQQKGT